MKQSFDDQNYSQHLRSKKKYNCTKRENVSIIKSIKSNKVQLIVPETVLSAKKTSKRIRRSFNERNDEHTKLKKSDHCLNVKNSSTTSVLKPLKTSPEMQMVSNHSNRFLRPRRRGNSKRFFHGWSWEGSPIKKPIFIRPDKPPQIRNCYSTIRHCEGDIIRVRDSVLLRSGPKKTDLPFVAKICDFWEAPENGDMMMTLLWYYRPEHTEPGRCPTHLSNEIFASKHRDVDSVACIDDKCCVLTYNEYCRYRKRQVMLKQGVHHSLTELIVPRSPDTSCTLRCLTTPDYMSSDIVFCCFKVYDFKQKRILKNPV